MSAKECERSELCDWDTKVGECNVRPLQLWCSDLSPGDCRRSEVCTFDWRIKTCVLNAGAGAAGDFEAGSGDGARLPHAPEISDV